MYINPIDLLGLTNPTSETGLSADSIKKAKRRLLAEIDLSDSGFYCYNGLQITKSDCENAIDQLNDSNSKKFYLYLHSHQTLNKFLANGNLSFFQETAHGNVLRSDEFIKFISSEFATKYDKALFNAFLSTDDDLICKIITKSFLISTLDTNIAYKSVSVYIQEKISEIEEIASKIKIKPEEYNDEILDSILLKVNECFPTSTINCLPDYFLSPRSKIATSINHLSNSIFNNLNKPQYSFCLMEYILTLNISGVDKKTFEENFSVLKKKSETILKKYGNENTLAIWENLLLEINKTNLSVSNKEITPHEAWSTVKNLFEFNNLNELNAIPDFGDDIRDETCIALRELSISIFNIQKDPKIALDVITFASIIESSQEIKTQLNDERNNLYQFVESNKDLLVCDFCDKNTPHESFKIEKRMYKKNNDSKIDAEYLYFDASIPRCYSCSEIHKKNDKDLDKSIIGGIIIGLIVGLFGSFILMNGVWFLVGGAIGWGGGYGIGVKRNRSVLQILQIKDSSISSLKNHPSISPMIDEGWTFNNPNGK